MRARNADCEWVQAPRFTKPRQKFPWKCSCGFFCKDICKQIDFVHADQIHQFERKDLTILPLCAVLQADRIPPRFLLIILKGNTGPDPIHVMCMSLGLYGGRGPTSQIQIREIRGTIFCVVRTSADPVPSLGSSQVSSRMREQAPATTRQVHVSARGQLQTSGIKIQ